MSNILKRIILFTIATPVFALLILFVPHFHYLWLALFLGIVGIQCGLEMRSMLRNIVHPLPLWTIIFPGTAPILSWCIMQGWLFPEFSILALTVSLIWAFSDAVFASKRKLSSGIERIGSRIIMVIYPGFFLWWIHRIAGLPHARYALFIFMLIIFLTDSGAWLFGTLFGRHRNLLAVSPNKSLEGYIAGIFASTLVIIISSFVLPNVLPHPTWQIILFGIILGITTTMGDLVESALKRATSIKDSGKVILGRGGMLDSIDSTLFTAPVFVLFIEWGGKIIA